MTNELKSKPPVEVLLGDDRIIQLHNDGETLLALTALGFILKADNNWNWHQVKAPISVNLMRAIQSESKSEDKADGPQET